MGKFVKDQITPPERLSQILFNLSPRQNNAAGTPGFAGPGLLSFGHDPRLILFKQRGDIVIRVDQDRCQAGIVSGGFTKRDQHGEGSDDHLHLFGYLQPSASLKSLLGQKNGKMPAQFRLKRMRQYAIVRHPLMEDLQPELRKWPALDQTSAKGLEKCHRIRG